MNQPACAARRQHPLADRAAQEIREGRTYTQAPGVGREDRAVNEPDCAPHRSPADSRMPGLSAAHLGRRAGSMSSEQE